MDVMVKVRNSNIELLRICCMLMIIGGHVMLNHHTVYYLLGADGIIEQFFRGGFAVAVNAFVLISGYYAIKFKMERLLRLLIQTWFYSVFTLLLAIYLGWHVFNLRSDVFAFFPVLTKQYWYVTCYVVLYLISPWLNKWVDSLGCKDYRSFLLIGFIIVYVWPTISFLFNTPQFIGDSGYGIVNFVYLYMLGRFLRLHYKKFHTSSYYWGGYFLSTITLFVCQYSLSWVLGFEFTSWMSYNSVFIFLGSVCLFMAFKEMAFSSSLINYWAKPCLAVYLIHFSRLWYNFCLLIGVQNYHGLSYILLIFILPVLIYVVCASTEILRWKLFDGLEQRLVSLLVKQK